MFIRSYPIEVDYTTYCKPHPKLLEKILHLFQYSYISHWKNKPGIRKKVPHYEYGNMLGNYSNKDKFFIGFLPAVEKYCKENNIYFRLKTVNKPFIINQEYSPRVKNIELRSDQRKAIESTIGNQFGRIIAPTRWGKTVVQLGIISMYEKPRVLLLAHTKDLTNQLKEDSMSHLPYHKTYNPKGSTQLKETLLRVKKKSGIVVCTIQSMHRIEKELYESLFDIIIVDECHHVNKKSSMYGKVLTESKAPRKYGFTATPPNNKAQELCNTGFLGQIIYEMGYQEAIKKKIIAQPRVEMHSVKYDPRIISNITTESPYSEYYSYCIVNNPYRNKMIVDRVKLSLAFNDPTLIVVEKLKHGRNIQKMIKDKIGIDVPFAEGETKAEERKKHLELIRSEKQLITICSRIWMEGITIQNLKLVIYAAAQKDSKRVVQAMGRGLGTTSTKTSITLMDFFDPYPIVKKHSIMRKNIYKKKKWRVYEHGQKNDNNRVSREKRY